MNHHRAVSVVTALAVVAALPVAAAALGGTVSTDPADAVDLDFEELNLGEGQSREVAEAVQRIHDQYTGEGEPDETTDASGGGERDRSRSQDGRGQRQAQQSADGGQSAQGSDESSGLRRVPTEPGPDWLLVAAVLAGLVGAGVGYRYRGRLAGWLRSPKEGATTHRVASPSNTVERAWAELLAEAGVDDPWTRTPRECAQRAVEAGYDPAVVTPLRRAFEDVRYGDAPPEGERQRIARAALQAVDEREREEAVL
ncbi:DUF4129 domain-containing protein [Haloarcula litorea]|uniref:DUF4129 domain-containing protein n=1 Tax=Haloarcula litorea TaxID=3032579 RepID=UPI0023E8252E|nr:DUF4129 domain-containing protein [Halomicroarcula sp. GDY20]